jgi:hypothetical protein
MLRPTVSRPVCLGVQPHLGPKTRFLLLSVASLLMWGALSDERTGLWFTIAADPCQRSDSQVRVPWDSWPYFTVSDSRLPQHGGPGPRIYFSQEHGGPIIAPGTRFPFCRLLRLAGLRWRHSNPPPHWFLLSLTQSESESESELLYDWRFTAKPIEVHDQRVSFSTEPLRS